MSSPVDPLGNVPVDLENSSGTPANVQVTAFPGTNNITSSQVALSAVAAVIIAARATRRSVKITNLTTTPIYIGPSGVTAATGDLLPGVIGAFVIIDTVAAISGITASGSASVSVIEEYN